MVRKESILFLLASSLKQYNDRIPDDAASEPVPDSEWVSLVERFIAEWKHGEPWHPAFLTGNLAASMRGVETAFEAMRHIGFSRFTVAMSVELAASMGEILAWPQAHRVPFVMPSIKSLHTQGVHHEQIARMYGLVEPVTGRGIIGHVEQELVEPGSVLGADFVHPLEIARQEKRAKIEEWLREFPEALDTEALNRRLSVATEEVPDQPVGPTTIEEAFAMGLSEMDASTALDLPVVQVMARYAELQEAPDPVVSPEMSERDLLAEEAAAMGIVIPANMPAAKIAEKIQRAKSDRKGG